MFKLLIILALIASLSACKADDPEPEDRHALPEPPVEEVPSPIEEEDTIDVPLHVPPVDPDLDDEEDNDNNY